MLIEEIYHTKAPIKIWSTPLGVPKEYRDELVKATYKQKQNAPRTDAFYDVFNEENGRVIATSPNAWEDIPLYNELLNGIQTKFQEIIYKDKDWGGGIINYQITSAWSGLYEEGQIAKPHHHIPSYFSFCYYMKAEAPYTPMVFDDVNVSIDAVTDRIIFFPSWVSHSVPPVKAERVFISGNMVGTSMQQ